MSTTRSVVIVAPNSFRRFLGESYENQFQVLTRTGHLASMKNLDILFNARSTRLDNGWKNTNPMAGYYLESFLKLRGYEAKAVFDWQDDQQLMQAMRLDPMAVLLSTTYITDPQLLHQCIAALQAVVGQIPIVVGGPYIWKQRLAFWKDGEGTAKASPGNDSSFENGSDIDTPHALFARSSPQALRQAIYIASEFGEYTLLRVLKSIEDGHRAPEDLACIPNLILPASDGHWHATPEAPEPVDLNEDYTRWDLIDRLPLVVPIRTSIGCPYKCRYCDFIALHPRVAMRSAESLLAEIRMAMRRGRNFVNFIDDNIFLSKKRIADLTSAILRSGTDILWGGFFRVDRIDESNIADIINSGCRFGMCGIESGDDGQLRRMRKDCKRFEIRRGIELATDGGLRLILSFIVGFPGETQESLDNTAEMVNCLSTTNKGYASFMIYPFYLLPGTAADEPSFRRQYSLTGRFASWKHCTMSSEDTGNTWCAYLFKRIVALPYDYYASDALPSWDVKRRNRAVELRRALTISFMDRMPDQVIQDMFSKLYAFLTDLPATEAPRWQAMLGDRSIQPGERRPLDRLGG